MSSKQVAAREDWTGISFANGWVIDKKLSCAEYRKIYQEQTGDTTKVIKNAHYLCHNEECGTMTYLERTVIKRAIDANISVLSKCKGCAGQKDNCHYSVLCREKNLYKVPDRVLKVEVGKQYGTWEVLRYRNSNLCIDHQTRVYCKCAACGQEKEFRVDELLNCTAACDCYRGHSAGEHLIKYFLEQKQIPYKAEFTFEDLVGLNGGLLRYDFAVFDNGKVKGLIEFDGQQHYQKAGTYYNEDGTVQAHDNIKNEYAQKHNIPLLRIPYWDIDKVDALVADFLSK